MRTGKLGSFLPTQSLVLCILCAAGILAFLLFIILPAQRQSAELDRDIESLKARIEEQKVLFPLFKTLFEKSKPAPAKGLTVSPRTKLSRGEISGVPKRLKEMAAAHRLTVRDIVPEVNTLADASNRFMVRLIATGQFSDLRGFLIDVGSLSFFESMEEIEIRAVEGGEEFGLKIWMARE
jgi:Tfp pilus assembly protein PilO